MNILVTLVVFLIVLLVFVLGVYLIVLKNSEKPEANRKWTDPKFHD